MPALREELKFIMKVLYVSTELQDLNWVFPINHLGVPVGEMRSRSLGVCLRSQTGSEAEPELTLFLSCLVSRTPSSLRAEALERWWYRGDRRE